MSPNARDSGEIFELFRFKCGHECSVLKFDTDHYFINRIYPNYFPALM